MGIINLKDIVALATAGYKPSEIKELISLSNQSEETQKEDETKDQAEKTEQHDSGREQPEEAQKNATGTSEEDSAILSYKKKIEELEAQVAKLQSDNVHKDQSDKKEKSDEEILNDLTASFM